MHVSYDCTLGSIGYGFDVRSANCFWRLCIASVSFSTSCRRVKTSRPIAASFFSISLRWTRIEGAARGASCCALLTESEYLAQMFDGLVAGFNRQRM